MVLAVAIDRAILACPPIHSENCSNTIVSARKFAHWCVYSPRSRGSDSREAMVSWQPYSSREGRAARLYPLIIMAALQFSAKVDSASGSSRVMVGPYRRSATILCEGRSLVWYFSFKFFKANPNACEAHFESCWISCASSMTSKAPPDVLAWRRSAHWYSPSCRPSTSLSSALFQGL